MATRYTAEQLLFLKDSPLCTKPEKLPPAEDWMGAPADNARTQTKQVGDRPKFLENPLLDQASRRTGLNHGTRNTTNPEDIVFAPPRMAFASSGRGGKGLENDRPKETESSSSRLNLRTGRNGELDADRLREGRTTTLRRRGEGEQDEGWSTVKPRKSFGAEGAERFHGRMGGNFRDEKKVTVKDKDDATRDRPTRAFDGFTRDRDSGDVDVRPRNGLPRNSKLDSPWHKHESSDLAPPEKKERDRTKSWRDRDTAAEPADDRGAGRSADRRWGGRDREQRVEREPEWFDEPAEANRQSHTQQDFQKWMEQMKKAKGNNGATPEAPAPAAAAAAEQPEIEKPAAPPAAPVPAAEAAPDKFFLAFGAKTAMDAASPGEQKDVSAKPKAAAKSSRFTSFFNQAPEEPRPRVEQPVAVPAHVQYAPPGQPPAPAAAAAHAPPPEEERQAFQQLLAKLQKQSLSATPPAHSPFAAPPQAADNGKKSSYTSPDPFQQYGGERRDGPIGRPPPSHVQEILAPRPQPQSARPEQLLQDIVGQQQQQQQQQQQHQQQQQQQQHQQPQPQHQQRIPNQAPAVRPDPSRNNSNTEFLMNLMRSGPESQHLLRMVQPPQQAPPPPQPQPLKPLQMPPLGDREPDFTSPRDNRPQRQMRPQPPPGFPMDDSFHGMDREPRPAQPTQILQRPPPPPGLDQMPPSWMTAGGQMPPPQQRGPMLPPPGLPGGPNRNINMPHMFPPNFPPVGMPPPDAMPGMPPRNMPMPPPGFFTGPPHGFIPPGLGGFNGPPGHADSHVFGGSPFETRGIPPAGNGRGAAYGRP